MSELQLSLRDISMTFQTLETETKAIKSFDLDVYKGEFVSIVGPSGCGKSTILNIIAGLVKPSTGKVNVHGNIGYMFQRDHLFEWRTVLKNCLLGPEVQGHDLNKARLNVIRLLETYGLKDFINHYPNQLSGGMRQRVALIRTLAVNPDILLLDEAFSALDYQTRIMVVDEVWNILRQEKKTALIVTHDIAEAISMSNRIVVMSKRPSILKAEHKIELTNSGLSPLKNRSDEKFRYYFDLIWEELELNE